MVPELELEKNDDSIPDNEILPIPKQEFDLLPKQEFDLLPKQEFDLLPKQEFDLLPKQEFDLFLNPEKNPDFYEELKIDIPLMKHVFPNIKDEFEKYCMICHELLNPDGKCVNLCHVCSKHKDQQGVCPDMCRIHNEHFVNGQCPRRCQNSGCRKHLDKQGKCPANCMKHKNTHVRRGLCPQCDIPIDKIDFYISLKKEEKKGKLYFPEFELRSAIQYDHLSIVWRDNRKEVGNQSTYVPANGYNINEEHIIEADISYNLDGKKRQTSASCFFWKKNAQVVERHIGLVGEHHKDFKGYDYYVLKVFSNPPEDNPIASWKIKHRDLDEWLKTNDEQEFDRAIRLYTSQIPAEGKLDVTAYIDLKNGNRIEISGSFYYSTATIAVSDSFDAALSERWGAVTHVVEPAIFLCMTKNSYGTAFAVSENDLITNYHVVKNAIRDRIKIYNKENKQPIEVYIKQYDEMRDLAWLKIKDTDRKLSRYLAINKLLPLRNEPIAALGFPYSTVEADESRLPEMSSSYGNIINLVLPRNILIHDAEIYSGNSGGPLVNQTGAVVGVNTLFAFNTEKHEMIDKKNVASPAQFMLDAFPTIINRIKLVP